MLEQTLIYAYIKDDKIHPEAINLRASGQFVKLDEKVINEPGKFQRISEYQNGLIVSEEITSGQHIFRFNKPYKEVEPGVLFFE